MTPEAKPRTDTQRMWDLVRQQRMELLTADLITQDEYAALAVDHPAVARLESYDELRAAHAETRGQLAQAQRDTERLDEVEIRGLTVENRAGVGKSVDPWMVREATGLHKSLTYWTRKTAREAIDAALRAKPEGVGNAE